MANKLAAMAKVMNNKATMPVLSSFLLEVTENGLNVTASDLECAWHGSIPLAEHDGTGSVCISASTLLEAVKNLPDQPITITVNDTTNAIGIEYMNGRYDMMGTTADEYPAMDCQGDIQFQLEAASLRDAIDRSLLATATDLMHLVMTGINFTFADGKMECAASDGRILVRSVYPLADATEACHFLLPSKAAKIIRTLLQKHDGYIEVELGNQFITVKTETECFSTRLIEGRYPNYNTIIPTDNNKEVVINRQAMVAALRRVSVFAERANRQLVLKFSGMALTLTGHDFDYATSAEEMVSCSYQGDDITISFGAENLEKILANMSAEEVRIRMSESCRAAIIEPASEDEQSKHLALIMPMLLPE